MIMDCEKWHYFAVKNLSTQLRGITQKLDGDYYCINCLHSFKTEHKLKVYENACKSHDYCYIEMSEKDKNTLKYRLREKSEEFMSSQSGKIINYKSKQTYCMLLFFINTIFT